MGFVESGPGPGAAPQVAAGARRAAVAHPAALEVVPASDRHHNELTVGANEFRVDLDGLSVSTIGVIKPLQLLVHPPKLVPGDRVLGVGRDGLGELPLGVGPLLLLRQVETLFVCLTGILGRQRGGDAERKAQIGRASCRERV